MKKEELNCKKLPSNPYDPTFQAWFLKTIPNSKLRKFDAAIKPVMMYRYVILMYDHRSPIHEIPDLDFFGKKFEAAEAAGFELREDRDGYLRFAPEVTNMLLGKHDGANDVIVDFLAWMNSSTWSELVYLQETLMRYLKEALGGNRGDKSTIRAVQDIHTRIDELTKKLTLNSDDTDEFKRRIYHRIEESRLMIRPEDYAKRIADGDTFKEDSPYGPSYIIGKIRFAGEEIPNEGE